MEKKIIIVGAGLAGSLCALYMLQRGYNVTVYERRSDMRKSVMTAGRSINLALSKRGWTALKKVGIEDRVMEISIPMPKRIMHDLEGELTDQYYGNEDQAIYSVPRGELNVLLMNLASKSGAKLNFNEKCIDSDLESSRATFENLKNKETKSGFPEASQYSIFFRSGKKNQWKKNLSIEHAQDIEKSFAETMKKFGYLN